LKKKRKRNRKSKVPPKSRESRWWQSWEDDLLLSGMDLSVVSERTGRSRDACYVRLKGMRTYGVRCIQGWTAEKDRELKNLLQEHTTAECAKLLDRTPEAIRHRARDLGIKLTHRYIPLTGKVRLWTKEEVNQLYDLCSHTPIRIAAKKLKRTPGSVQAKAARLGILWDSGYTCAADIAKEFNVETCTVCRVIKKVITNPKERRRRSKGPYRLSDTVADKVRAYFLERGYRPKSSAQRRK